MWIHVLLQEFETHVLLQEFGVKGVLGRPKQYLEYDICLSPLALISYVVWEGLHAFGHGFYSVYCLLVRVFSRYWYYISQFISIYFTKLCCPNQNYLINLWVGSENPGVYPHTTTTTGPYSSQCICFMLLVLLLFISKVSLVFGSSLWKYHCPGCERFPQDLILAKTSRKKQNKKRTRNMSTKVTKLTISKLTAGP